MKERRFTVSHRGDNNWGYIVDHLKHITYFFREDEDKEQIVYLLNFFWEEKKYFERLYKENEHLQFDAEAYNEDAMNYQTLYEQQVEKNERLKKENQGIQDKVMRLLNYVELKQCVTKTEIKKWWNGDVQ